MNGCQMMIMVSMDKKVGITIMTRKLILRMLISLHQVMIMLKLKRLRVTKKKKKLRMTQLV